MARREPLALRRAARDPWTVRASILALAALLAMPPIGAAGTSEVPAGHRRMIEALREIRDRLDGDEGFPEGPGLLELRRAVDSLPPDASVLDRFRAKGALGERMVLLGRERDGVRLMEEAHRLLPAVRRLLPAGGAEEWLLRLASAWMRVADAENGLARRSPDSFLLPLRGGGLHARQDGARRAVEVLDEVLISTAPSSPAYRHALWLLNVAAMDLGMYPGGLPEKLRIPSAWFEGEGAFPRFPDVADRIGAALPGLAGGVVAEDLDGDGDVDLFVTSRAPDTGPVLLRNEGDGTFSDRSKPAGLEGLYGGSGTVQADYDNDGFVDLLVLRGSRLGARGRRPKSLLRNNGDGTFTDRAYDAGIAGPGADWPSATATWLDYDGDGLLDVYVGNEADAALRAPCQLFHNNGDGTFTDRAMEAGVANLACARSVAAGDFDGDRFPDLYVSNEGAPSRLYRNRGDGTFEDVAARLGAEGNGLGSASWFWDFDADGALDLLVHPSGAGPADLAAAATGEPTAAGRPLLFRGDGKGGFREVGRERGMVRTWSALAGASGDLDDDGFPDVHVAAGRAGGRDYAPDAVLRNRGGARFEDVSQASGMAHLLEGHAVALADLDGDGDLDVVVRRGGLHPADRFPLAVHENPGSANHRLEVRLRGTTSNRSAVGARVRAGIVEGGTRREVHASVGGTGGPGSGPLRVHLGLGGAAKVEVLEVSWPATGKTQVFRDLPVDRIVEVVEDRAEPAIRNLRPVKLGGGSR
jgi:hypothetical protein